MLKVRNDCPHFVLLLNVTWVCMCKNIMWKLGNGMMKILVTYAHIHIIILIRIYCSNLWLWFICLPKWTYIIHSSKLRGEKELQTGGALFLSFESTKMLMY